MRLIRTLQKTLRTMSLFDQISNDLKAAMLAREKERLESLRAIKTALLLAKTESGSHELTSDQELKILQKLVKQRREAAEIFQSQQRMDLYQKEIDESAIIEAYLPAQLTEAELDPIIRGIIEGLGASGLKDMGRVMAEVNRQLAGKADSRLMALKVKQLLGVS